MHLKEGIVFEGCLQVESMIDHTTALAYDATCCNVPKCVMVIVLRLLLL